jgi:benzoylformate decarboxylase
MLTVREATLDLLRAHGMTTIFGNPGSTELPMLADFPDDFRYVLGLQEAVVVGMADGYAQASGRAAHANLHTAPGVGNAMGALFTARANKAPLLITAGQQVRAYQTLQANLTNHRATEVPQPYVKWSFEPPRAADVPAAIARAIHTANLPPAGPAFVSIPMDDWAEPVDAAEAQRLIARRVHGRAAPDPRAIAVLADRLAAAQRPVLVAGPGIDAAGAWADAVALAQQLAMPVWATPAPGGGRLGFPESHPLFAGVLPPAIGPAGQVLGRHDLVLVVGSSVFPYYPYVPGPALPAGTELVALTDDPDEAARAPVGDAIVGDVAFGLEALMAALAGVQRPGSGEGGDERKPAPPVASQAGRIDPAAAFDALAGVLPDDAIVVLESPSTTLVFRDRVRLARPGSFYFGASGGLGFGLAAAVGVQLARPDRPVVCVVGEGSAQYAITALWTAQAYAVPVTFLVMRNDEYAILKWFATHARVHGAPGLDLPGLDVAATAASYGVRSVSASAPAQLRTLLAEAIADERAPRLVQALVTSGAPLL